MLTLSTEESVVPNVNSPSAEAVSYNVRIN